MNQHNLHFFVAVLQDEYLTAMSECVDKYLGVKYIHEGPSSLTLLLPHFDDAAFRAMGQINVQLLNTVYWLRSINRLWVLENTVYMNFKRFFFLTN